MAYRREHEIKYTTPFFQSFLVDIMRRIYEARLQNDIYGMAENIKFLFYSLPGDVKNKINMRLSEQIRRIIESTHDDFLEKIVSERGADIVSILDASLDYCMYTMQQYSPGTGLRERYNRCVSSVLPYFDLVYNIVVDVMHENNIFVAVRSYEVGANIPPGAPQ